MLAVCIVHTYNAFPKGQKSVIDNNSSGAAERERQEKKRKGKN